MTNKNKPIDKLSSDEINRASDFLAQAFLTLEALDSLINNPDSKEIAEKLHSEMNTAQSILLRGTEFNTTDKIGDPLPETEGE
jgi:hypothetical protein